MVKSFFYFEFIIIFLSLLCILLPKELSVESKKRIFSNVKVFKTKNKRIDKTGKNKEHDKLDIDIIAIKDAKVINNSAPITIYKSIFTKVDENNKPALTYYGLMLAGAVARSGIDKINLFFILK